MEELVKFFFELGKLKDEVRSGWKFLSVDDPESVAGHSFRAALIGYFLAKKEGADENKVMKMLLFHDVPETRIGDIHKVAKRYINKEEAEKKARLEQSKRMPKDVGEEYENLVREFETGDSREAIVARDADLIECSVQAREYMDEGHPKAERWIINANKELETETAREIIQLVKESDEPWWHGLKEI